MKTDYTLLLGSNLEDKERFLTSAGFMIADTLGKVVATSGIFRSSPWGFESDEFFLNQALVLRTSFQPLEVLAAVHRIENALGRVRADAKGYQSRTIDIDIIHWSGGIVEEQSLKVPHPMLEFRRFVLLPVSQVIPDELHPRLSVTYRQLIETCTDASTVEPHKTR